MCNRLKMKGWQFDNLTIEEKILKWLNQNVEKELSIEIYKESIIKEIEKYQSWEILISREKIPKDYEMGNPNNRWIFNVSKSRTPQQFEEDNEKIKAKTKKEFKKIEKLLVSINQKCGIKVVQK